MPRLKKIYFEEIIPALKKKFKDKNIMALPKLKKIVISMGIGKIAKEKSLIEDHINELSLISGQKPIICKAKNAISNFKTRRGMIVGLMVTLRNNRMYDFVDRFINIVCPRIRDFRGFAVKSDGYGNFTIGVEDQQSFPEVNLDKVKREQGMNITFVTSAENDEELFEFLKLLKFPIKQKK